MSKPSVTEPLAAAFVRKEFVAARPAPVVPWSLRRWMRANLFSSVPSTIATLVFAVSIAAMAWLMLKWAVIESVGFGPVGKQAAVLCRAVEDSGACWPVVQEKSRLILFGLYPYTEQWRPATSCALMVLLYLLSSWRRLWRPRLAIAWLVVLAAVGVLMWGGVSGLPFVPDDQWGGLPVTLFLSTFGLALAFPLAIALALLRQSLRLPALKALAVAYIELARGIPLLTVLFMASVMFPLFLPEGANVSKLLRVQVAIALFAAAYLAEVIRGGLQALGQGQHQAADALGFSYWDKTRLIILPQALRLVIPGIVNTFISFFKATSIVIVVGIFDLMTAAKRSVADPLWQGFGTELYLFVGLIYFAFCFSMSRYSQALEARLRRQVDR